MFAVFNNSIKYNFIIENQDGQCFIVFDFSFRWDFDMSKGRLCYYSFFWDRDKGYRARGRGDLSLGLNDGSKLSPRHVCIV